MKNYIKKLLLGTSLISPLTVLAATVSCGNNSHPKAPKELINQIEFHNDLKLTAEEVANIPKIAVIPDGNLYDKSFHQSGWEGVIGFAEYNNIPFEKYDAYEITGSTLTEQYEAALNSGAKIFVLVGFDNQAPFTEFYKKNKQKFIDEKIVVLTVDFATDAQETKGSVISLLYDTKPAAFMAGYAAGEYYSNLEESKRTYSTFGGQTFEGVTDYMEGFMKGIYYWNTQNPTKKLTWAANDNNVYTNALFNINDNNKQSEVNNFVISHKPGIILGVGGLWTQWVSSQQSVDVVVGVDTDQALADIASSHKYFTSIFKNIAQSVYEVLSYYVKDQFNKLDNFSLGSENVVIKRSYEEKWVDISKTHLTTNNADKATTAIKNAHSVYENLSEELKNWIRSQKATIDSEEISDIQTRLNALAQATK
ncbi:BMP family ABC transporter substrate-binding protein [Mycoplasma sp. 1018B]|uniref:BMP family ABC transporter substrate-binding protein n=1 Tax=Mycoplasma sp. 1018B TaxID=2967302 RepID=UPI00211CD5A1|nr:BMP family ABC transporter substrate-binding protein [Mycoplasma sp. 1018B]UUM19332.1 BMP family ABC transporter substrate-binding protein [Mycoplasma sp. 1018B]